MRQLEFQGSCTILRNATETNPLHENVRKIIFFFIKIDMKLKAVKKSLGSYSRSVFNTQYNHNHKKVGMMKLI